MKLPICVLFAGILIECITVMVASPLDKSKLYKPTDKELSQRLKREPDMALVLSIIDKNSRKIKKLEIGVDDDGFDINGRPPKITSEEGKLLISKLLQEGGVQIKSNGDDSKTHKWKELFETLKDVSSCEGEKSHTQKVTRGHSSDDDKLDQILQLLANLNGRNIGTDLEEDCDDCEENSNDVKRRQKPKHIKREDDSVEEPKDGSVKRRAKPPHIDLESPEDCDDCEENSNDVKRRLKPKHIEREDDSVEEPKDGSVKRRAKPPHIEVESPEDCDDCEENSNDVKRRQKPKHIEREDDSVEEPKDGSVKRRPKPPHVILESPEDCDDCEENSNDVKRRQKPKHIEREDDSVEEPKDGSVKRRPKPPHVILESPEDCDDCEENSNDVKRRLKPKHIEREDDSVEEPKDGSVKRRAKPPHIEVESPEDCDDCEENSNDVKRRQKPKHIEREDDSVEEPKDGSVKRRPKPPHVILESPEDCDDCEENSNDVKRRQKPKHIEREDDSVEEPKDGSVKRRPKPPHVILESPEDCDDCEENSNDVKRRQKPKHIEREYDSVEEPKDGSVKRRPKPPHIELESPEDCDDCEENSNDVKRRQKPKHIEREDDSVEEPKDGSVKRRPKPPHVILESPEDCDDCDENSNDVKRRQKPKHIEREEEPKDGSVKRRPKPPHIEVESPEDCDDCEENSNDVKRRQKPKHIEREDDSVEEPKDGSVKRRPKPPHVILESPEDCDYCDENSNDVKRRQKPKHIEREEEPKDGSVKRRPKPPHIELESPEDCDDCEENSNDVKRRQKPKHIEREDDSVEEPKDGSVKRRPKPPHVILDIEEDCDDCEENSNDVKRRQKPKHIERKDDSVEEPKDGSVKRRPKPPHIELESPEDCDDCEENSNDVKRRQKPKHIEREDDSIAEPKDGSVKRRPKPPHIEVESPEDCDDCEENSNDVKRRQKPKHIERKDDSVKEPKDGSVKRRPKPPHVILDIEEDCDDCEENSNDVKRRQKPKHIYDRDMTEASSNEDEESESCPDDLDEEQLLQGIAFVQSQLKRFLGIECTCNPTENTVLNECPIHARRRRGDQDQSILNIRSSEESGKEIIKNKKFTKKATLKDSKKVNRQPKKSKKNTDSSTADTITNVRVNEVPKNLPRTTAEDIIKLLKELGLSVNKMSISTSEASKVDSQSPSKKPDTNNEDLQFFRHQSSVHRSSTNGEPTLKKNRRKLRDRRKGRKTTASTTTKRKQRGIASEEIAAEQDAATPLRNYKTENHPEEVILSRPVDIADPDIESLKSLFDKYKQHVAAVKQSDNLKAESGDDSPHATEVKGSPAADETATEMTESVENLLKQISPDESDWTDDSNTSKEYVIAQESDSNYRNLYNKFANLFGDVIDMDSASPTDSRR